MKSFKPVVLIMNFIVILLLAGIFINLPKMQTDTDTKVYKKQVRLILNYQNCGHTLDGEIYENITYSTEDELTKRFEGYKIAQNDDKQTVLTKNVKGYCPKHYIAVLKNNKITISNLFDGKKVAVINTNSLFLSDNEKKLLSEGYILNSEEALTSFIEDFTS